MTPNCCPVHGCARTERGANYVCPQCEIARLNGMGWIDGGAELTKGRSENAEVSRWTDADLDMLATQLEAGTMNHRLIYLALRSVRDLRMRRAGPVEDWGS